MVGRKGDMLMSPFHCNVCWFVHLKGLIPTVGKLSYDDLLTYIIRVNPDVLWSKSYSTVNTNKGNFSKMVRMCESLGISPTFESLGPWSVGENVGFTVVSTMVKASTLPGKYADYQQFDTVRHLRTAFSNAYEVSYESNKVRGVFR